MTGTSLAEMTPDRWTMLQRMARAFAESDMVPDQMKGNIGNCSVALLMAEHLGENPVMVVQNIFFVKGRPGWSASYMIARANLSGKFIGPLRWRTEGIGDDLAVTCYAHLRDAPADDNLVEVTVSMAIARADGWTRNDKYKSMPENMLVNRSATWLIRRYCPEVLMGYSTSEELDDVAAKDVTPQKFGIDDFKPGRKPAAPAPVIEHEPEPEAQAAYNLIDADGIPHSYDDPESAFEAFRLLLQGGRDARGRLGLNAAWQDGQACLAAIREDRPDLAELLETYYDEQVRALPIPAAQKPASEPPAPEPPQAPEPALPLSAPAAAARTKRTAADWSAWRQTFDHEMRLCQTKDDLAALFAESRADIWEYNHALPRAAGFFTAERDKRMKELSDG